MHRRPRTAECSTCCCLWHWRTSNNIFCLKKSKAWVHSSFYYKKVLLLLLFGNLCLASLKSLWRVVTKKAFLAYWTDDPSPYFSEGSPFVFGGFFLDQEKTLYLGLCQQGFHGAILVSTGIACLVAGRLIKSNSRWKWAFSCSSLHPAAIPFHPSPENCLPFILKYKTKRVVLPWQRY